MSSTGPTGAEGGGKGKGGWVKGKGKGKGKGVEGKGKGKGKGIKGKGEAAWSKARSRQRHFSPRLALPLLAPYGRLGFAHQPRLSRRFHCL